MTFSMQIPNIFAKSSHFWGADILQRRKFFQFRKKFLKVHKLYYKKLQKPPPTSLLLSKWFLVFIDFIAFCEFLHILDTKKWIFQEIMMLLGWNAHEWLNTCWSSAPTSINTWISLFAQIWHDSSHFTSEKSEIPDLSCPYTRTAQYFYIFPLGALREGM